MPKRGDIFFPPFQKVKISEKPTFGFCMRRKLTSRKKKFLLGKRSRFAIGFSRAKFFDIDKVAHFVRLIRSKVFFF